MFEPAPDGRPPVRRRLALTAAGAVITAALLGLVLGIGSLALEYRRYVFHEGRVRRLVEQHPEEDRVVRGVLAEADTWEIARPRDAESLRAVAARCGTGPADEVARRAEGRTVRVFGVAEMVYFLYFDDGRLADGLVDTRRRGACEAVPAGLTVTPVR